MQPGAPTASQPSGEAPCAIAPSVCNRIARAQARPLGCWRKKAPPGRKPGGAKASEAVRYLLANVGPRFHTDSDLPPEAGVGLLTLS
jgi:hypothetical protein